MLIDKTRLALVTLGVLALTVALAGTASAARTFRGTFDFGFESFVDTVVCAGAPWGFDVFATEHEYGFFEVFFADDGTIIRVLVHNNYDATISANGNTIYERDTWTSTFYPDGTSHDAGLTVHIQGPGGIVVRDAGRIVRDSAGNVVYVAGPHQQLFGVSFCPALAS